MTATDRDRDLRILAYVREHPGLSAREIARKLDMTDTAGRPMGNSAGRALQRLEAAGMVYPRTTWPQRWHPTRAAREADDLTSVTIEYGQLYSGGTVLIWNGPDGVSATLDDWIRCGQRNRGRVARRVVHVVEDWHDLPPPAGE